MKSSRKSSLLMMLFVLGLLAACVGGQGSAVGEGGGLPGGGAIGEGQPTIQPGADQQPAVPIEPDDDPNASDDLAIPPPPPTDEPEEPGLGGADGFTY